MNDKEIIEYFNNDIKLIKSKKIWMTSGDLSKLFMILISIGLKLALEKGLQDLAEKIKSI